MGGGAGLSSGAVCTPTLGLSVRCVTSLPGYGFAGIGSMVVVVVAVAVSWGCRFGWEVVVAVVGSAEV